LGHQFGGGVGLPGPQKRGTWGTRTVGLWEIRDPSRPSGARTGHPGKGSGSGAGGGEVGGGGFYGAEVELAGAQDGKGVDMEELVGARAPEGGEIGLGEFF
jgi:hypothetical protein